MRNFSRSLLFVGGIALLGGLAACGDDVTVTPPTPPVVSSPKVTGVTVTPGSSNVRVGGTQQLNAGVTADSGAAPTVTWKSSDVTIASVDGSGKVTGVKVGTVGITATATANGSSASGSATVNVTNSSAVTSFSISPQTTTLAVGGTQATSVQLVLDATSGVTDRTISYVSSAPAVATVDANGVITGVAAGSATITASPTADPTFKATVGVTVATPRATSISIQSITFGNLNTPVNPNAVTGQIAVTLNVDQGDVPITKVYLLVDGIPVDSQSFSAAQLAAAKISASKVAGAAAASTPAGAPVQIVMNLNTAFFSAAGIPSFFNGTHVISAKAVLQTGQSVATAGTSLNFQNQSGFVVTGTNHNPSGPDHATNPSTGLSWIGGDVTVTFLPVSFVQNVSFVTLNVNVFEKDINVPLTNGSFTMTFLQSVDWAAADNGLGNYTTDCFFSSVVSSTSKVKASGAKASKAKAPSARLQAARAARAARLKSTVAGAQVNSCDEEVFINGTTVTGGQPGSQAVINAPTGVRVDNSPPNINDTNDDTSNGVSQNDADISPNQIWVNATTAFAAGSLGVPASSALSNADAGVDDVTSGFWFGPAGAGAFSNATGSCDLTGLTKVTVGGQLPASIVSTAYQVRVVFSDALGNKTCQDLPNPLGADFTAPTGTFTGPGANAVFTSTGAVPSFAVTASDNASGFGATPLNVSVTLTSPTGTQCVYGTTTTSVTCANAASQTLTFNQTTGATLATPTAGEGYYTASITLTDQAGNSTVLVSNRVTLVDATAPGFSSGISLQSIYNGNVPVAFFTTATDNIDLNDIFGILTYPTASIRFAPQQVGAFGTPFTTSANVTYTIQQFIRCLNLPGDFTSTNNQPNLFQFAVSDFAGHVTTTPNQAIPSANVQACGPVGDVTLNSFIGNAPNYGGSATQVSLSGTANGTTSSSVTLSAVADVPLNTSLNPFSHVEFYWFDGVSYRPIGTAAASLTQTQTNRTWNYTLVWSPRSPVTATPVNVIAIGVDSGGDAVQTIPMTVNIVP